MTTAAATRKTMRVRYTEHLRGGSINPTPGRGAPSTTRPGGLIGVSPGPGPRGEMRKAHDRGAVSLSRCSVLETGLEPARPFGHQSLKLACLPIPPLQRGTPNYAGSAAQIKRSKSVVERGGGEAHALLALRVDELLVVQHRP